MSRHVGRSSLRWSSLLALGAVVAWSSPPAGGAVQQRLTCASPLLSSRHSDRLSTLLARSDARGALAVTGPATLVPMRGLERLREADFGAEQAVAVLDLTADQGALPRGRYCMTAQLAGSDPNVLASWTVRYYAMPQGRAATTTASHTTRGLAYREVDVADGAGDGPPRPAARFHFVRRRAGGPASGPAADGGLFHRVAHGRGAAQEELDFYSAWYRCGNGCCGASLNF